MATVNKDFKVKNNISIVNTADTATAATHYIVETGSDGVIRPKTLANVKTEIVTTAAVNSAAATTVGTVTSGTWNATAISATYIDAAIARLSSPAFTGTPTAPTATAGTNTTQIATTAFVQTAVAQQPEIMVIAVSDETTSLTTGTAKITMRAPFAMTLTDIPRANLTTASTSGLVKVDINESGVSILGANKLSIDANERTSTTAATATTLADTSIADDAEITIDIDAAGTGAKGLKIVLYFRRT